jgi:hypothetical protein
MKENFEAYRSRLSTAVKRNTAKEVQAMAILLEESDSSQINGIVTLNENTNVRVWLIYRFNEYIYIYICIYAEGVTKATKRIEKNLYC